MTQLPDNPAAVAAGPAGRPAGMLARQLAAAGLGVQVSGDRDTCQLIIVGVAAGKSLVTLAAGGQACWYYEPAAGLSASPAAVAGIIAYLLGAPPALASRADYQALPFKGQAGRLLHDHGLAVRLRVSEDWESFEATTSIEVTSPARPHLGTVRLADDAALDWSCDLRAAFAGNPAAFIDVITPILRASYRQQRPG